MWRAVSRWCVLGIVAKMGSARADQPPSGTPAPVPTVQTAAQPPAQPAPPRARSVDRDGILVMAGIDESRGDTSWRLDAILPVPLDQAPHFRIGLMAQYDSSSGAIPGVLQASAYGASAAGNALYDWLVPIAITSGDVVISVEGGIEVGRVWLKIDEPFMPGTYQTLTAFGLRSAAALQYRGRTGLVISLQPLGLDLPLNHPSPPDPRWTVDSSPAYDFALLAGYQFR